MDSLLLDGLRVLEEMLDRDGQGSRKDVGRVVDRRGGIVVGKRLPGLVHILQDLLVQHRLVAIPVRFYGSQFPPTHFAISVAYAVVRWLKSV